MSALKYCDCFFAESEAAALADQQALSAADWYYCQGDVPAGATFTLPNPMNTDERKAFNFVGPEFDNTEIWCYYLNGEST